LGGKLRSRNNALRHGLARRIDSDPIAVQNIERLARILAGFSNDFCLNERARTIAECYFDMQRIHAARTAVLQRIGELEAADTSAHAAAVRAIEKINRYERRVLSKRGKAVHAFHNSSSGIVDAVNDTVEKPKNSASSFGGNH
jgi:hypothetical protein